MALTVTLPADNISLSGTEYTVRGTIDFDAAYPAGGEALTAANIGLSLINSIEFQARQGYMIHTETVLPATSVNVLVVCPSGGTAPTSIAAPTEAISAIMAASGADSTALVDHTHAAGATTGGQGIEMGAADLSTLTGVPFLARGV